MEANEADIEDELAPEAAMTASAAEYLLDRSDEMARKVKVYAGMIDPYSMMPMRAPTAAFMINTL